MSNFIKMRKNIRGTRASCHRSRGKSLFHAAGEKHRRTLWVMYICHWPRFVSKKNVVFQGAPRPQVGKRDPGDPITCTYFHAVQKEGGTNGRKRDKSRKVESKREESWEQVFSVSSRWYCATHLFTFERTWKSIRSVVSLSVEVASTCDVSRSLPTHGKGGMRKRQSSSWILTIVPSYLPRPVCSTLSPPDIGSVSGTLMPCSVLVLGFFVFVSRTMGFVSRGISRAP